MSPYTVHPILPLPSHAIYCCHYAGGDYGILNFGTVKVFDAVKQTMQLKNKGKYAIGYQ